VTDEQQALIDKARESAEEVRLLSLSEGKHFETAVSRAYYGMFYLTKALLLRRGLTAASHKQAISSLGENSPAVTFSRGNSTPI
jgi:uncharacterized protein (UPF0332 family)